MSKTLRDLCIFAKHNLLEDPPFSQLDPISCRNVLIYLRPEFQRRVFDIFHYALKPSGFLMLGRSETASGAVELFASVDKKVRASTRRSPLPGARSISRRDWRRLLDSHAGNPWWTRPGD